MTTIEPVVIIGAGPVGLAAASHLILRGIRPVVLERGDGPAANVRSWGHVRLFSPWRYCVDAASRELLVASGWRAPDPDAHPTGHELVSEYLAPLASTSAMRPVVRFGASVVSVSRLGIDRMSSRGRQEAPYRVVLRTGAGVEVILTRAVIDASGTFSSPNPLGADGVPAQGEHEAATSIWYGIPDVLQVDRARYAGRRVLVVGSGHSAFNALIDLATLVSQDPTTTIDWVVRRTDLSRAFGGGTNDQLAARGQLGDTVKDLAARGVMRIHTGFAVEYVEHNPAGLVVASGEKRLGPFDEIIVATGFRPDLTMTRELRLAIDPIVESPAVLAPLIDPNLHSCGSVPPHGVDELSHPDKGFYILGMKSYGRAPTFLMLTGFEQARSVAAAIAGDWEAAREVRLVLPETGVCTLDPAPGASTTACCAPSPAPEALGVEVAPIPPAAPPAASSCCSTKPPSTPAKTSACCS
ncbi:MAG: FAD-dependent oxidoreductase [Myxococcales bacterium]|nr:FAD-dependent oxidoreductase [Myxococcales bacterium]